MAPRNGTSAPVKNGRTTAPIPRPIDPQLAELAAARQPARAGKIRLMKVIVQPVVILDDGDLTEIPVNPIEVHASLWPAWAESAFNEASLETLRTQIAPQPPGG